MEAINNQMTTEEQFWNKVKKTDNINDCWI